jgi:hypothetical protein
MNKNKSLGYNPIPVVKNVRFAKNFRISVPNKFKKFLLSIGLLVMITMVISFISFINGETAAAGTIDFKELDNMSYRIISQDGSISRMTNSFYDIEYGKIKIGDVTSKYPIASKEDKLQWIEGLIEREKELQQKKTSEVKKYLISILKNEKRAEYVQKYSKQYQVPLYLTVGVIFAESSNRPEAVSYVGARGLMQLMPDTAVLIARRQGMAKTALKIRKDPSYLNDNEELNIKFGCKHLRDLYNKIGSWEGSVHAYNQGYTRYMKGYRSNDYVGKVFKYWRQYKR